MIFNCKLNGVNIRGKLVRGGAGSRGRGMPRTSPDRTAVVVRSYLLSYQSCKAPTPLSSLPSFTQPFISFYFLLSPLDTLQCDGGGFRLGCISGDEHGWVLKGDHELP